jgi:DNA repair exonuclease SbcCD ATPase subunit
MSNFMSTGIDVDIPLDIPGLVLLSGDNQDAPKASGNGSGKSTVLSGITYALYGKVPSPPDATIEADDVIHNKVGKDCKVELFLDNDDGSPVHVIRTRKDSTSEKTNDLILEVNSTCISASTNEMTQEKINAVMGMDYETFCTLMPGLGREVAAMSDADIKELLEKILHTEELSIAHDLAKEKVKALEKVILVDRQTLSSSKAELNQTALRLVSLKANRDLFDNDHKVELKSAKIEKKKSALEARAADNLVKARTSLASNLPELVEIANKLKEAKAALTVVHNKSKMAALNYASEQSVINTNRKAIVKRINTFENLSTCPTCFLCVDDSHKSKVLLDLRAELAQNTDDLKVLNTATLATSDEHIKQTKAATELVEQLEEEYEVLNEKQKYIDAQKKELSFLEREAKLKLRIYTDNCARLTALEAKTNQFVSLIETEEERQRELEDVIHLLVETLQTAVTELAHYEFWVKAFSASGIRSNMMENVVPYLNERAKYYCDRITAGEMSVVFNTKTLQKSGKVVDKLKIEVSQQHGCSRWKGSSKGERARAALVIALSLGDLASLRVSKKLSFRAIDEVLDSIDEAGDDAIVELLKDMQSSFGTIYVVTHKNSLKDKFSKELVIQKKNGFSTLKGVFDREAHS